MPKKIQGSKPTGLITFELTEQELALQAGSAEKLSKLKSLRDTLDIQQDDRLQESPVVEKSFSPIPSRRSFIPANCWHLDNEDVERLAEPVLAFYERQRRARITVSGSASDSSNPPSPVSTSSVTSQSSLSSPTSGAEFSSIKKNRF